ncbi:MAG: DUF1501 domain-containing protein [Planctomycetales bacterium]|nr:DUF1501 domain-containing protein [Planctomycetales bacterium]
MLTISDPRRGFSRRDFLRIGGLALGASALPSPAALQAAQQNALSTGKSVVFLFLHGGPSQTETFDPKMSAPSGVRSATGERATRLPGVTFGSTFERLANLADRMTIVRSFRSGNGNHDIKPIVCKDTGDANLGALYARAVGANRPDNGMPTNAAVFPRAVEPASQKRTSSFGNFVSTGGLGSAYQPFVPGAGGELQEAMRLSLSPDRLDDRRQLLGALGEVRRRLEHSQEAAGLERMQQQAFETILGGVADAFDLSKEDPKTIARYDTAPLARPDQISRKWNNYNNYVDNAKTLGKLMLLARRLCEAGCGFVTVTTNFVWDMHADVNNVGVEEGMQYMGLPLDYAVSAFIEDCKERGLSDDILLVVTGEMGRTPRINARGGRDHWGGLTPLLLSGGGLSHGQVIGTSTSDAGQPQSPPIEIPNLVSTIMHTLVDVGRLRIAGGMPAEVIKAGSAAPIPGLA